MPGRVICSAIVVCLALLAHAALAQDVTVEGNRFLRDGEPWVAEGVTLVGLVSPAGRENRPTYAAARAAFGPGTLGEVRRFGADLVRFQVSQTGLDPKSKDHDPGYRDEVLDAVALTRAAGLNVIVSMVSRGEEALPSGVTRRAWRTDRRRAGRRSRHPARDFQRTAREPSDPGGMAGLAEGDAGGDRHAARRGIGERAAGRRHPIRAQSCRGAAARRPARAARLRGAPLPRPAQPDAGAVGEEVGRLRPDPSGDGDRVERPVRRQLLPAGDARRRPRRCSTISPSSGSGSSPGRSTCRA